LLAESRDRVKDLRHSTDNVHDLAEALAKEGNQFGEESSVAFRVSVQGTARELHALVCEEGFLIAREAMGNAFRHAQAEHIEVDVSFGQTELQVRVRDDGQGMNRGVEGDAEPRGHFGLIGMRERAQKIGATLDIWSSRGAGTEVELRVPAAIAYRPVQVSHLTARSRFSAIRSYVQRRW
jgi:signal transduction histidine kinase